MKKILIIVIILLCAKGLAQVKGNKEITETYIETETITDIEVGIYGDITIDAAVKNGIFITADGNLLKLIDTEVVDGKLRLDQKKWIQPSQKIKITVGAPAVKRIQLETNDQVKVLNLECKRINTMALNGTILLEGKAETLSIGAENGTVDARRLNTKEVFVNIWGMGKAQFDTAELLDVKLSKEAELEYNSKPGQIKGNISKAVANSKSSNNLEVRYIDFKIRNNSDNRQNFYVIGPKPDGRKFSYGFPMMPGAVRKEHWTTGTKVYRVSGLGIKKLLVTIDEEAEDNTVDLFN